MIDLFGEFILKNESESTELAHKIAQKTKVNDIIAFSGNLGSGKSFFCREIIKYICGQNLHVISPTFNLLQLYPVKEYSIYHFDLYRLKYLEEIYELGIEDAVNNNICLIEWPEIIYPILPRGTIYITIAIVDQHMRKVQIKSL